MSRIKLLTPSAGDQKREVIQDIIDADKRLLSRKILALDQKIDDFKAAIKKRMRQESELDESIVQTTWFELKQAEAMKKLYQEFFEEYYPTEQEEV